MRPPDARQLLREVREAAPRAVHRPGLPTRGEVALRAPLRAETAGLHGGGRHGGPRRPDQPRPWARSAPAGVPALQQQPPGSRGVKRCSACLERLPLSSFSLDRRQGHSRYCQPCAREAARRWYSHNRARKLSATTSWKAAHPNEVRRHEDTQLAKRRTARRAIRDLRHVACLSCQVPVQTRAPRARCLDCRRQVRNHRAEMRKRQLVAGAYSLRSVGDRDGWRCHLCGGQVDPALSRQVAAGPTIDHVRPLSKGGADVLANVRLAHRSCNVRRGARALPENSEPAPLSAGVSQLAGTRLESRRHPSPPWRCAL
jgi:hypothetical protein